MMGDSRSVAATTASPGASGSVTGTTGRCADGVTGRGARVSVAPRAHRTRPGQRTGSDSARTWTRMPTQCALTGNSVGRVGHHRNSAR
jgi:hypothetical protein